MDPNGRNGSYRGCRWDNSYLQLPHRRFTTPHLGNGPLPGRGNVVRSPGALPVSKVDEQLVKQVLAGDQARDWLSKLTPVFFESAARRQLLEEVRVGLAGLAPGIGEEGLRSLGDEVVQELCRQASRHATPPPRPDSPPVLSGYELEEEILQKYPYPIAAAYQTLTEQDTAASGFGCLLDTFEALVHYLTTVAVCAYLRTSLQDPDCNRFLLEMLVKRAWSTGDLFALLRETVRSAGGCGGLLPYPLPALLFTPRGKPSASCQVLESFISLRNRH